MPTGEARRWRGRLAGRPSLPLSRLPFSRAKCGPTPQGGTTGPPPAGYPSLSLLRRPARTAGPKPYGSRAVAPSSSPSAACCKVAWSAFPGRPPPLLLFLFGPAADEGPPGLPLMGATPRGSPSLWLLAAECRRWAAQLGRHSRLSSTSHPPPLLFFFGPTAGEKPLGRSRGSHRGTPIAARPFSPSLSLPPSIFSPTGGRKRTTATAEPMGGFKGKPHGARRQAGRGVPGTVRCWALGAVRMTPHRRGAVR